MISLVDQVATSFKWDRRFLELAKQISTYSRDPSTKVGAVLVNRQMEIMGTGYNGFPRGVVDDPGRYNDRELKYEMIVHAEVNAILTAGHRARDSILYVYPSFAIPCICHDCAKVAIQAGVLAVIGYHPSTETAERALRWKDSIALAKQMLEEARVQFWGIKE